MQIGGGSSLLLQQTGGLANWRMADGGLEKSKPGNPAR
jgi:hypothetical protein